MAIPISHERDLNINSGEYLEDPIIEECIFCGAKTRYWHVKSNKPLCPDCAKNNTITSKNARSEDRFLCSSCRKNLGYKRKDAGFHTAEKGVCEACKKQKLILPARQYIKQN